MDVRLFLFILCLLAVLTVFLPYPVLLIIIDKLCHDRNTHKHGALHAPTSISVCLVSAFRNPGPNFTQMLQALVAILDNRPSWHAVLASDGSDDGSQAFIEECAHERVRSVSLPSHQGKTAALNAAVATVQSDILVFFDADSRFDAASVDALLVHFGDADTGGVSGRRCLGSKGVHGNAQRSFFSFDATIKSLESRVSSLTSNEGKLYAIRRSLFRAFPDAVTDDLFSCLSVITQGKRFVFEGNALVAVPNPLRTEAGELVRRRRIVGASLRTLWLNRELFVPWRYGLVSIGLFINKIMRRFLPMFLVGLYASNLTLIMQNYLFAIFGIGQTCFYFLAVLHPVLETMALPSLLRKIAGGARYFVLGNMGTLLGVWDYMTGRAAVKWNPTKPGGSQ